MIELRLSDNFRLSEFIRSEIASRFGWDNTPPPEVIEEIKRLTTHLLQPLRGLTRKRAINLTSGYRCERVNKAVGSSNRSSHRFGRAADVWLAEGTPLELGELLASSGISFDKAILEHDSWLHLQKRADGRPDRMLAMCAFKRRVPHTNKYNTFFTEGFTPPDGIWID